MALRLPRLWRPDAPAALRYAAHALSPLGFVVEEACQLRYALVRPVRVDVPVICVGNLTVGGAGKTPVAIALAERLRAAGLAAHFLSRGYGGSERGTLKVEPGRHDARAVGDEALLLARTAPTWIARSRPAGARAAAAAGAQAIVMDDGFQNPWLYKDLSLIVIDGDAGFGNGLVMPAGPLRETPEEGLLRADAIVLIGEDATGALERCQDPELPLLKAELVPEPGQEGLRGASLAAFAGIGNPRKFFKTLEAMGCRLLARRAFPDHHAYGEAEIERLVAEAGALGAQVVTTEKDAVRLPPRFRDAVVTLKVTLRWENEALLDSVLRPVLKADRVR